MVILVRCPDQTVSVALKSRLPQLVHEGLISAYLGADGWVALTSQKTCVKTYPLPAQRTCRTRPLTCV